MVMEGTEIVIVDIGVLIRNYSMELFMFMVLGCMFSSQCSLECFKTLSEISLQIQILDISGA